MKLRLRWMVVVVALGGCTPAARPVALVSVTAPPESSSAPEAPFDDAEDGTAADAGGSDRPRTIEVHAAAPKPQIVAVLPDVSTASTPHEAEILRAAHHAEKLFDEAQSASDLTRVVAAYRRALSLAGSTHALSGLLGFKLGWTHYRLDDFASAFEAFWPLVDDPGAAPLREECLDYLAIVVAEPSWTNGSVPDPLTGLDRPEVARRLSGSEPWIYDFVARVAMSHALNGDYAQAARSWDRAAALAPDPERELEYREEAAAARARP